MIATVNSDDGEHRNWYESWLDDLAGERVSTLPLFGWWVLGCGLIGTLSLLLFGGTEDAFYWPFAGSSFIYWFFIVPPWVRRRSNSTDE